MSTQEVPEWFDRIFDEIEEMCAGYGLTLDSTAARQTILSHMIDRQKVEEVLNNIETLHWDGQVSDVTDQIRQALNLNGDE